MVFVRGSRGENASHGERYLKQADRKESRFCHLLKKEREKEKKENGSGNSGGKKRQHLCSGV